MKFILGTIGASTPLLLAGLSYELGPVNAIRVTNKESNTIQVQNLINLESQQQSEAQWGFLKNIVNIDTFFSSGIESSKKSSSSSAQTKSAVKDQDTSQLFSHENKDISASQKHSKMKSAQKVKKQEIPDKEDQEAAEENSMMEDQSEEKVQLKVHEDKSLKVKQQKQKTEKKKEKTKKPPKQQNVQSGQDLKQKTKSKEQIKKEAHAAEVREEGIVSLKKSDEELTGQEIDLEIEAPGAATKVAEEGAKTIQNDQEFKENIKKLMIARSKPENKIGEGGKSIELKAPQEYADSMKIVVLHDQSTNLSQIKMEKFQTKNPTQAKTAAMAMQMTLETNLGATIIDDGQPGRESLIGNFATDQSKTTSQIVSGYAIRNSLTQKMAPGDKMFYIISYEGKINQMNSFKTRDLADAAFTAMKPEVSRIMMSGETGDILQGKGEQNWRDQCLGMFLTQRYQGKYFGQS